MNKWKKMMAVGISGMIAVSSFSAGVLASSNREISLSFSEDRDEPETVSQEMAPSEIDAETNSQENVVLETEKKEYEKIGTTGSSYSGIYTTDVSEIVKNTIPSIVAITSVSKEKVQDFFLGEQEYDVEGTGSGIIIAQTDDELLIATNKHVVSGANSLTVCFSVEAEDNKDLIADAVVKGTNASNDLAVVSVPLSNINEDVLGKLKIATIGSSSDIEVGDPAIVIGNALGVGQTVTTGIISALEREIQTQVGTFKEFQTDAAINLGCSGGAILNNNGEVIGIVSAKATSMYADNMGYGIPVDEAVPILQNLINTETRTALDEHGFLGITAVPVSDEAKQIDNMPSGAFVFEVNDDSAAKEAGIEKGNIIIAVDGREISTPEELVDTIALYAPGETIDVTMMVAEQGSYKEKEVSVTLKAGPDNADEKEPEKNEEAPKEEENKERIEMDIAPEKEQNEKQDKEQRPAPEGDKHADPDSMDGYDFFSDYYGTDQFYNDFFGNIKN